MKQILNYPEIKVQDENRATQSCSSEVPSEMLKSSRADKLNFQNKGTTHLSIFRVMLQRSMSS